jgi:acyl dehydratase
VWTWHEPIRLGEELTATVVITSVEPKLSRSRGPAALVKESFVFRDGAAAEVAQYERTTLRFAPAEGSSVVHALSPATYSPADLDAIGQLTQREISQRRGFLPRDVSSVRAGDDIGAITKGPLSVTSLIAWIAGWGSPYVETDRIAHRRWTTARSNRLTIPSTGRPESVEATHWEPELASLAGMPAGYDFGAQRVCWLYHLVADWAGAASTVISLEAQVLRPNVLGDLTTVSGSVVAVRGTHVTCEVSAHNQRRELTARAQVVVALPCNALEE